jgi:hypothetical protein
MLDRENVRGAPSYGMTLNDPGLRNTLDRGRRARSAGPSPAVKADPQKAAAASAAAAAAAFAALNFKDLKLSGFANVSYCHTTPGKNEPERWGRLGIMTRERLVASDRFGDIAVPEARPFSAPILKPATYPRQAPMARGDTPARPSQAESSGFTRRPILHSAKDLTGGFEYKEPDGGPPPPMIEVKVVGNKLPTGPCHTSHARASLHARVHAPHATRRGARRRGPDGCAPPCADATLCFRLTSRCVRRLAAVSSPCPPCGGTGFAINNHDDAAEDAMTTAPSVRPPVAQAHYARTSIGASGSALNWYNGVGARVSKYGEMRRRKLAPHETGGAVNTLRVETSGFTRNRLHERDHVRQVRGAPTARAPLTPAARARAPELCRRCRRCVRPMPALRAPVPTRTSPAGGGSCTPPLRRIGATRASPT